MNVLVAPTAAAILLIASSSFGERAQLHDVSGLAWIAADSFLVVHDAKYPDEADRPRAGIITLPTDSAPYSYAPLEVVCGCGGLPIHDLESVSPIPGTRHYVLAESGDNTGKYQRIYLAELSTNKLHVRDLAPWPADVHNVEGMAVARLGHALVLMFAERAHGNTATEIRYTTIDTETFAFGELESVTFETNLPHHPNLRPISALEVDELGRIFAASAVDPERDTGPFSSYVWEIGRIHANGGPTITPSSRLIATLDGVKVEGLTVRDSGSTEIFVGTDDEAYGGIVRPLP